MIRILRPALILLGTFAALSISGSVSAQTAAPPDDSAGGDIRGIVSDSTTGEKILGVNVRVMGTTRGATTNLNGFYLIGGIPPGSWQLVFSAIGYERKEKMIRVKTGEQTTIDVRLVPRMIEAREVVVEGQSSGALLQRNAMVHSMTPGSFKNLPTTGQPDLLRALQLLPGITSTSDASAKFYVRGGAGDQNLFLLDGMKVYNPYHAFGLFSVFDPDIIRNVDVYTGAFPAGFGGRLSSVVNVTTRDGNLSRIAGAANVNFMSGKLRLEGPIADDNAWLLNGRSSLFTGAIDRLVPNPAPTTFYDLFFKGTAGTSTGRVGFRGYFSGDDVRPNDITQPDYRWRNSALSAVFSSLQGERLYFDVVGSYSRTMIERLSKDGSIPPARSFLDEVSLRGEFSAFTEGEGTSFEGFEFTFPSTNNSLPVPSGDTREIKDGQVEVSVWYRYEGEWGPWRVNLGLHADLTNLATGGTPLQSVQPRVMVAYDLGGTWNVRLAGGTFSQNLITVSNEDDLVSLFDAWLYLPKELRPEQAYHGVFALEGNLSPSIAASLQVYGKSYPSLTLYNSAKVFPDDPDYVKGDGLAYGAEFLVRYASPLADLNASYAWSRVDVTAGGVTYAPRYDRRNTVKVLGTVHLLSNLDFTLRWEYGSGYPFTQGEGFYSRLTLGDLGRDPFPGGTTIRTRVLGPKNAARLPAYYRVDAGVNYSLPLGPFRAVFGASVVNVSDAKNILYYDRTTGKTEYMTPFFPSASFTLEY
jgi:hypothetical protein